MLSVFPAEEERAPGFQAPKVRCNLCCLQEFCTPQALTGEDVATLKQFVNKQDARLRRGEQAYRQGDPFRALVAVHTGSFKLCAASADGVERVKGFALAGDVMGLDAIDSGRHGDYAVALEDSGVCLLPWRSLEEAAARVPLVRRQMMRMLSRELRRERELGLVHGQLAADRRFVLFLLSLSRRYSSRGFDGARFRLPMTRPEIGSYLGLTPETVSRLFTRFRGEGLIRCSGRHLLIVDADKLQRLAEAASSEKSEPVGKLTHISIGALAAG